MTHLLGQTRPGPRHHRRPLREGRGGEHRGTQAAGATGRTGRLRQLRGGQGKEYVKSATYVERDDLIEDIFWVE